jgi:FAD/FMN-containing dehydrogenase
MKATQTRHDGHSIIEQEPVQQFKDALRGELIYLGHEDYEKACTIYNAMIDKKPALIARCVNVADVITSVNFAREQDMLLAIRSGGHNGPGLGTCDDGLVIDLSPMKGIRVDPQNRTATVQAGCTWGDVDHATHAFGLAVPSGLISTTGVGGLTLGGGLGHLTRKCGLTIDNLLEADLVLADGSFVTANAEENSDLYWAIRGGGGNFGVVTSFKYRLHPIKNIVGGPTLWPLEQAPEVMRWYRNFITQAPENLNGFFAFMEVPPAPPFPEELYNKKMCGIVWCYAGPLEKADEIFAPVQEVGTPALHGVQEMPYPALQTAFDALYPPGMQWYWKADFVTKLSDEAIEEHLKFSEVPTLFSTMHLYPVNGAAHKVGKNDTAWSFREANWGMVIVGVGDNPDNNDQMINWARDYWDAVHPYSSGGAYVNMIMDEGDQRLRDSYRDNYDRLAEIKTKYDPENLFRVNQNIPPEGWESQ